MVIAVTECRLVELTYPKDPGGNSTVIAVTECRLVELTYAD